MRPWSADNPSCSGVVSSQWFTSPIILLMALSKRVSTTYFIRTPSRLITCAHDLS
jgi:hypothetical protein